MSSLSNKIYIAFCSGSFIVSKVRAEGSIILDSTEASVDLSGEALVFCAILIATFAVLVIVKILLSRGES